MTYPEIIKWLAKDVAENTESKKELEANVDRYMEDLAADVQKAAPAVFEELTKLQDIQDEKDRRRGLFGPECQSEK